LLGKVVSPFTAPPDELGALDEARVRAFHRVRYHPTNTILAVSGAVVREQVLEKLAEVFGRVRGTRPPAKVAPPASRAPTEPGGVLSYAFLRGRFAQPRVVLSYKTPPLSQEDYAALSVAAYVLGKGKGSLLARRLIGEATDVRAVDCRVEKTAEEARFVISLIPNVEHVDAAEVGVLAALEVMREEGVLQAELERAKAQWFRDYYLESQSLTARAARLAACESSGNAFDCLKLPTLIRSVDSDDLKGVLEWYFTWRNLSVREFLPEVGEPRTFTADSLQDSFKLLLPAAVLRVREAQEAIPYRLAPDSAAAPGDFAPSYAKTALKRTSIIRGPVVYFQENHTMPLVHLGLFYAGGRSRETDANAGLSEVALRAVLGGAVRRKGALAWTDLELLGAEVEVVNEPDFFGWRATALSTHFEAVLTEMIQWARHPEVDDQDVARALEQVRTSLSLEAEDASGACALSGASAVWPHRPYGRSRYGGFESLNGVETEAVRAWLKAQLIERHPTILAVGDLAGTSFLQGLVSTLSDRRYQSPEAPSSEEGETGSPPAAPTLPSSDQGCLVLAGPRRTSREAVVLEVIENVLSGAGGRLCDELWNKQGLAFPVVMTHQTYLNGGTIRFSMDSRPGKEGLARRELLAQLDRLRNEPLKREEVMLGMSRAIASFYARRQNSEFYVTDVASHFMAEGSADQEVEFLSGVRGLRGEEIQSFAERYLRIAPGGNQ
jgi:zinc protease